MPDFQIIPAAQYTADNDDWSNPITASDVTSPATVSGLTNGTAYRAREIIGGPASSEFTPVAPSSIAATLIGHYSSTGASGTPSAASDLTSLESGDLVLVVVGTDGNEQPTLTVGGSSTTAIVNTIGGAFGSKLFAFEYVATGSEGASVSIVATYPSVTPSTHVFTVVRIEGAARDDAAADDTSNETINATAAVTPAGTPNIIVAVAQGRSSFFGGHAFVNVTQSGSVFTGSSRSAAIAFASDVAVAELTVEFDPDPTGGTDDEAALVVVAYS